MKLLRRTRQLCGGLAKTVVPSQKLRCRSCGGAAEATSRLQLRPYRPKNDAIAAVASWW